jgi:hypothetical protein
MTFSSFGVPFLSAAISNFPFLAASVWHIQDHTDEGLRGKLNHEESDPIRDRIDPFSISASEILSLATTYGGDYLAVNFAAQVTEG